MTLKQERDYEKEGERAARLLEFVKAEVRDMNIHVRMDFVIGLFNYLAPELRELIRKGDIEAPR